jgi:hypothetical protein
MLVTIDISPDNLIQTIREMDIKDIERIKEALIKQEIYFKRFKKAPIPEIMHDFKKEKYSPEFLKDLEKGLSKSSVYAKNNKSKA